MRTSLLALPLLLAACVTVAPAPAQQSQSVPPATPGALAQNDAERAVHALIARDGITVVHFWAPWCDNSVNELREGWYAVVEENPDVEFAFVTVWNDGGDGRDALQRYAIPDRVRVLTQPDGRAEALRRREFLGMPVTWIPTTWVFREGGELAFAFNYGELTMPQLQAAIQSAAGAW